MKKYFLNLIILAVFALGSLGFFVAKGQTSLDYYSDLFKFWGLDLDTIPQISITKPNDPVTKKDFQTLFNQITGKVNEESIVTNPEPGKLPQEDKYLLILASQQTQAVPEYKNVIIITSGNEFSDLNPNESSSSGKVLEAIKPHRIGNKNIYRIPQTLLLTPNFQKYLAEYFKSVAKSDVARIAQAPKEKEPGIIDTIGKQLQTSALVENTKYVLFIFLIAAVLLYPLKLLVRNPRKLIQVSLYAKLFGYPIDIIQKYRKQLSLVWLVLALFYIPIINLLLMQAQVMGDPFSKLIYVKQALNPIKNFRDISSQTLMEKALIFYNYTLLLFAVFLILPNIVLLIRASKDIIKKSTLRPSFIKWSIPALVAFAVTLLSLREWEDISEVIFVILTILVSVLLYLKKSGINYEKLFSKKERAVCFVLAGFLAAFCVLYPLYQSDRPAGYKYVPLIDSREKIVTLPYTRKLKARTYFEPFFYQGTSQVFADGYLIYSPGTEQILNKPLHNFSTQGEFLIVTKELKKISYELLNNPQLPAFLASDNPSTILALNNNMSPFVTTAQARITFNCSINPKPTVVKIEVTSVSRTDTDNTNSNKKTSLPISTKSTELLNFPGCDDLNSPQTFVVPLNASNLPIGMILARLRGVNPQYISEFKIYADARELPAEYLSNAILDESKYTLAYESKNLSSVITSYSTQISKDIDFTDIKTSNRVDLSVPINKLISQGRLGTSFILWSDSVTEVIQTNL